MKLQDAKKKMKPGDEWSSKSYSVIMAKDGELMNYQGSKLRLDWEILEEEGEIIPAEPVVLSAEDWMQEFWELDYPIDRNENQFSYEDMIVAFTEGSKKGRLERHLELEPVIKSAELMISNDWDMLKGIRTADALIEALKNIHRWRKDEKI